MDDHLSLLHQYLLLEGFFKALKAQNVIQKNPIGQKTAKKQTIPALWGLLDEVLRVQKVTRH